MTEPHAPTLSRETARSRVAAAFQRIEAENPRLNAVEELFADAALARADALDRAAEAGQPMGPLHGVPVLFKGLVDVAGYPTRFGSRAYAERPARRNAPVIDRLEVAGAVILGTTNMVEFAVGSWGTNHIQGTPWNPADPIQHRIPGGSSSGSAVAVAAGFAPIAFGSDTGGSIRIPASLCGVVGYKPSYGLIPMQGVAATGASFDTLGPLARSVSQVRIAAEAASGCALSYPGGALEDLRMACVREEDLAPINAVAAEAYSRAISKFANAGARIAEISLPMSFIDFQALNGDIVAFEAYRQLGTLVEDEDIHLDPYVRKRVKQGASVSATMYQARLKELHAVRRAFDTSFHGQDVLILPGTPMPAPTLAEVDESQMPMSRYTRVANCLNLCAIALPVATHALPTGIQLAMPWGADAQLLAIAETAEDVLRQL